MRLNPIAAALSALALIASCSLDSGRFTVRGNVADDLAAAPGSKVYLLGPGGWDEPIDSTVVRGGKFTLKGNIDPTTILTAALRFRDREPLDNRFKARFIPDTETIVIDLDYPETVTGSPLTDRLRQLQEGILELYRERESEIGDLAMNDRLAEADSIYRIQMQRINDLCKSTYLEHTGDFVGLQALSILARSLDGPELAELVSRGAPFIAEDPVIRDSLDAKGL